MRNEGSKVKKNSKINLAGKKGKMVVVENGLKNGPIENGLIKWSRGWRIKDTVHGAGGSLLLLHFGVQNSFVNFCEGTVS
jgi:hypothetical protein